MSFEIEVECMNLEDKELAMIPDTICPVCDGLELHPSKSCPDCGYSWID